MLWALLHGEGERQEEWQLSSNGGYVLSVIPSFKKHFEGFLSKEMKPKKKRSTSFYCFVPETTKHSSPLLNQLPSCPDTRKFFHGKYHAYTTSCSQVCYEMTGTIQSTFLQAWVNQLGWEKVLYYGAVTVSVDAADKDYTVVRTTICRLDLNSILISWKWTGRLLKRLGQLGPSLSHIKRHMCRKVIEVWHTTPTADLANSMNSTVISFSPIPSKYRNQLEYILGHFRVR